MNTADRFGSALRGEVGFGRKAGGEQDEQQVTVVVEELY